MGKIDGSGPESPAIGLDYWFVGESGVQVLHEVVELADQAVEMFLFSVGASDPLRCLQILGWGPLRLPGETERWETARSSARESLSARPIEGIDVAAIHTNAAEGQARAERALAAGVAGRMSTPDTGLLKSEQVRPDEARAAWQHAIESGHPELAPIGWISLGVLEAEQDRPDEARAAWQHAIKSGHPELAPKAWNSLGMLEYEQGQTGEARAAWQHAAVEATPQTHPVKAAGLSAARGCYVVAWVLTRASTSLGV